MSHFLVEAHRRLPRTFALEAFSSGVLKVDVFSSCCMLLFLF